MSGHAKQVVAKVIAKGMLKPVDIEAADVAASPEAVWSQTDRLLCVSHEDWLRALKERAEVKHNLY